MDIMGTGITYPTGELLLESRDEQSIAEDLRKALPTYAEEVVSRRASVNTAATFRAK